MKDVDAAEFADRLLARLKKCGLSQSAAAKRLGIAQQSMQNVCAGKVKNPRFINELAELLLTTRVWLLFGEPPEVVIPPDLRSRANAELQAVPDTRLTEAISALKRLSTPPPRKNAPKAKSVARRRVG